MAEPLKLNLIPDQHKGELRRKRFAKFILHSVYFIVFLSFVIAFALLGVRFSLQRQFAQIVADTAAATHDNSVIEDKATTLNATLQVSSKIINEVRPWEDFLSLVGSLVPTGVQITHLDLRDGEPSTIEGIAQTREVLLTFKNRMSSAPYVANVEIPLTDLLTKTGAHFTMHFTLDFRRKPQ